MTTTFRSPLQSLRVIEFGQFIAVPAAAQTLCEWGAEVIKIEKPSGDDARHYSAHASTSPMFVAYNRGKKSVCLDLKSNEGRTAAQQLIESADVVLENYRPGVMDSLGLGAASALALNPRLIYASVSGFGTAGDNVDRPGLDVAAQAESGMMRLNGVGEQAPLRVGYAVVDVSTSLWLTNAVLAALFQRERTGRGEHLQLNLFEVAVHQQAPHFVEHEFSGRQPGRTGNGQTGAAPAADVLTASDGQVVVSAYLDAHWKRLCQCIGKPELAQDTRFSSNANRTRNRNDLIAALNQAVSGWTVEQTVARLSAASVVVAAIQDYAATKRRIERDHPRLMQRAALEGRDVSVPSAPVQFASYSLPSRSVIPAVGEHTEEVLSTLRHLGT